MAIEFDSAGSVAYPAAANPYTFSVTVDANSNFIVVGHATFNRNSTGAKFNGVAMTSIAAKSHVGTYSTLYYLVNPTSGTHSVVINFASGGAGSAGASVYTNVDINDPIGSPVTAGKTSTAISVNAVGAPGGLVVDIVGGRCTGGRNFTVGAGQTQRYKRVPTGRGAAGSDEASAASVNMSWTASNNDELTLIAVHLNPLVSERARLIKYWASTLDPKGRIFDNTGRVIPASLVEYDNWLRNEGPYFMTPKKHTSLIEADSIGYLEAIKFREGGQAQFVTETETLLESLFRRLGGRGA